MNYEKPALNLLASAVTAIQNPTDKSDPDNPDNVISNPLFASASAYAADE